MRPVSRITNAPTHNIKNRKHYKIHFDEHIYILG